MYANSLSTSCSTNHQLTSIPNRSDRRDIRAASRLCTDKAEDESKNYAKEGDADILLVLQTENEAGEKCAENDTTSPHPPRYLLGCWRRIYNDQAFIDLLVLAEATDDGLEERVEGGDECCTICAELGEGAAKEQESAWPNKPLGVSAVSMRWHEKYSHSEVKAH